MVLQLRAVDSDMRWVLSLVLAAALSVNRGQQPEATALQQARGIDAADIRTVLAEMGAAFVVSQADPLVRKMRHCRVRSAPAISMERQRP